MAASSSSGALASPVPFPGFSKLTGLVNSGQNIANRPGQQILYVLNQDESLKTFTTTLFKQVSDANRKRIAERPAGERLFFDSMATLLTADETCAAIALSGDTFCIATNCGDQDQAVISYEIKARVTQVPDNECFNLECFGVVVSGEEKYNTEPVTRTCRVINSDSVRWDSSQEILLKFNPGVIPAVGDEPVELHFDLWTQFENASNFFTAVHQKKTTISLGERMSHS